MKVILLTEIEVKKRPKPGRVVLVVVILVGQLPQVVKHDDFIDVEHC